MAGNKQAGAAQAATTEQLTDSGLTDDMVRDYLTDNPDFLQRHPDMLDNLQLSHASGSAVSLVERQVSVLRERNMDMRHRLNTLTASARANDTLFEQTSALVLKLLEADSAEAVYAAFTGAMADDFDVEHACMILYSEQDGEQGWRTATREQASEQIGGLFQGHKPVCGTLRKAEFNFLFPGKGDVGSAALVPLVGEDGEALGLLAVGSSDANRYSKHMGTLFLAHIADVIIRLLPRLSAADG